MDGVKTMDTLLGQKVRLHKESKDDASLMSISGEIVKNFHNTKNVEGFFLLKLDKPFAYSGVDSHHVLFWSSLIHRKKNIEDHADAFILLIPDMQLLNQTHIDESKFIPLDWAKVSRESGTADLVPDEDNWELHLA